MRWPRPELREPAARHRAGDDFNGLAARTSFPGHVSGYDLVTGWGSPRGQSLIDALASSIGPNFALVANPSLDNLTAGPVAEVAINASPSGRFDGIVDLTATVVGNVAGVSAELSAPFLSGAETATLTVSTTRATAVTFQVAVTGMSGNRNRPST